jgi:hypothetical protein
MNIAGRSELTCLYGNGLHYNPIDNEGLANLPQHLRSSNVILLDIGSNHKSRIYAKRQAES